MKKIYVCSPYSGRTQNEITENKRYAAALTRIVVKSGDVPITPHLYLTAALDERIINERQMGLNAGMELLKDCDAILIGADKGISKGMHVEIEFAVKCKIPMMLASIHETEITVIKINEN